MLSQPDITLTGDKPSVFARVGRVLASPVGVLVTMPLVVVGAGLAILLVGRDATRTATEALGRRQLAEQAQQIEREVAYALDQAHPVLESLRGLAERREGIDRTGAHLYDLAIGRPGVAYASISYPDGTFQGAYRVEDGSVQVQESRIEDAGTRVQRFTVVHGALAALPGETTSYDPRERDFYQAAIDKKTRVWTRPYTFFKTHETGITCTEPLYADDKSLRAVITVDFDVGALSAYIDKAPVPGSRTLVFTEDGTILAFPYARAAVAKLPAREGAPLHETDLHDPVVTALFAAIRARGPVAAFTYLDVSAPEGGFLASVTPIGGLRAGAKSPLVWYAATLVPKATLLGDTGALMGQTLLVSAIALAIAVGLALVLAWNLVRMRRAVASSRAAARAAEDRARELGSWRMIEKLGEGGMGEVWRAEHRLLVRDAAIKLMRPDPRASARDLAEARERFRREAQTLAAMKSRHTIGIYDYGVTDEQGFYYVMELLDGIELDRLVGKFGPQPAARVIQIMHGVCASLAEAHEVGLLHRDIKPANIFLCRAADEVDVTKLLDFGIVHVAGQPATPASAPTPIHALVDAGADATADDARFTEAGTILGTPGFMSPEQARGFALDGRADLYALGCVAWLLLTGKEVFDREGGPQALLFNHVVEPVPSLARRVPGWVPIGLVDAVTACLAKEPAGRPQSARALMTALRAIPIPEEHAWTDARAQEWWRANVPPVVRATADATGRLLVAAGTKRGSARPSADAATVRAAPGAE